MKNTAQSLTQASGANGGYVFAATLPGRYAVLAEMKCFTKTEKQNLKVTAAERLSAEELILPVGELTESVTVDATGTPVQIASANVPQTLRGRNHLRAVQIRRPASR
jgi:hypothetical protein